jgi:hypothetical protein
MRIVALILLAIFLVLYGLMAVTNVTIALMSTLVGLSALAAGVLIIVAVARREL